MINDLTFHSQFGDRISLFISEKRALGYKYCAEAGYLKNFDQFVCRLGYTEDAISKELFDQWTNRRFHEREKTCQNRTNILTQFCKYVVRIGGQAYIPHPGMRLHRDISYRPHIFTDSELTRFLAAVQALPGHTRRKEVMYMLFSLLICTGMRLGEALWLEWGDVDFMATPVLITIRKAKFDKERIIPIAGNLSSQLLHYSQKSKLNNPDGKYVFPSIHGTPYPESNVYITFRKALWKAGISHGGSGKGPRIHDFRHTFAVKSLRKMVLAGEDIMAVMPLLSQYLGHKNIYATQTYLQFTADMYPYVTETMEKTLGSIIPGLEASYDETH